MRANYLSHARAHEAAAPEVAGGLIMICYEQDPAIVAESEDSSMQNERRLGGWLRDQSRLLLVQLHVVEISKSSNILATLDLHTQHTQHVNIHAHEIDS